MEPNQEKNQEGTPLHPLRTYEQDVRDTIANQNMSVVKIALAQSRKQESQEAVEDAASPTSKRNIWIIISSVLLVVVGAGVIGYSAYYIFQKKNQVPVNIEQVRGFIAGDTSKFLTLENKTKREISLKIDDEIKVPMTSGSIETIAFRDKNSASTSTISSADFLTALTSRAPASFLRSIDPMFTFGLYSREKIPFIIIKVDSFDQGYAGMLGWEPFMRDEFRNILFPVALETAAPVVKMATTTASTTASTTAQATTSAASTVDSSSLPNNFTDLVVNNKDTRVLRNRVGDILLIYGFINKQYIVITRDTTTLNEVFERIRLTDLIR